MHLAQLLAQAGLVLSAYSFSHLTSDITSNNLFSHELLRKRQQKVFMSQNVQFQINFILPRVTM